LRHFGAERQLADARGDIHREYAAALWGLRSRAERGRELQSGIAAEETIQLPPRDTKKSDKLQTKEEEDIRRGRELREQHGDADEKQRVRADGPSLSGASTMDRT
jgi:hypothetical protein